MTSKPNVDLAPNAPRGRPPLAVLLLLGALALSLHGCLLEGVPIDGALPPSAAGERAAAVHIRSLAEPSAEGLPAGDATAPAATEPPPSVTPLVIRPQLTPPRADAVAASDPAQAPTPPAEPAQPVASTADAASTVQATEPASPPAAAAAPASVEAAAPVLRRVDRVVPTYKTRMPPATTLVYDIRRGILSGTGELSWRPEGGRYELQLRVGIASFNLLTQISQGGFDAAGLAPLRFTDQRGRRAARAANFQREARKISYSGSHDEYALPDGAQDRLSWMIQLPAVLAAEPRRAVPGGEVLMVVSGARADVAVWSFAFVGVETIASGQGKVRTLRFTRTPQSPRDVLADVWLDPARHHFPVRARLSHGDEDDVLELVLRTPDGVAP